MDQRNCQTDQIASYLDDELDDAALITFEAHLKECFHCKAELAEQRGLLGTLNSAFGHGSDLKLPGDFARIITAHAESDMSGVRGHREHQRALRWCAILSAASLALLGVTTRAYVVGVVRAVGRPVSVVLDLTWTTIYDAVTGLTVISRVVSRGIAPGSHVVGLLGFLLLAFAVLLLSRLIASYHRARLIE